MSNQAEPKNGVQKYILTTESLGIADANAKDLADLNIGSIIANPNAIPLANDISNSLENEKYRKLWLMLAILPRQQSWDY